MEYKLSFLIGREQGGSPRGGGSLEGAPFSSLTPKRDLRLCV